MAKIRSLRSPLESRRALAHRKQVLLLGIALAVGIMAAWALLLGGCGGGSASSAAPTPSSSVSTLSAADVGNIVQAAAVAAAPTTMVIAVVDRAGNVLALYRKPNAPATVAGN
ncbi:MAG TPA: hypothetical protein VN780_03700, partial [Candidatus Eisenbacteria bacterium]|nr:hypothetical protein [Candidatus Eisenbacteria bacterium]